MRTPTVLLVEDQQLLRAWLTRLLDDDGYSVLEAGNAEECMSQYTEHRPDVVLLDIGLPKISGLEVLKEIRELDPAARVVMLTAWSEESTLRKALELGALDYVIKPFSKHRVLLALARALG